MQSFAQSGFQSDSSEFESRRPYQFSQREYSQVARHSSAKADFIGSNPIARSNFYYAETWWNGSHNCLLNSRVKTRAGLNPVVSANIFGRMPKLITFLKNDKHQFHFCRPSIFGRMLNKTTSMERAFEWKLKRSSVRFRQFMKINLAQQKTSLPFCRLNFYVDCSLTGLKRRTVNTKNASSNLVNPPKPFSVAKHKGCALVCRTRRCEFESRRHRQIFYIYKGEKTYVWK